MSNKDDKKELEYMRRMKKARAKLKRGSDKEIADELGISIDTVRNAKHLKQHPRWDILEAIENKIKK